MTLDGRSREVFDRIGRAYRIGSPVRAYRIGSPVSALPMTSR